jgi:hypothetical protein
LLVDDITHPRTAHSIGVGIAGSLALALLLLCLLGGLLFLLLALALRLVLGRFVIVFVAVLALLAALAVNVHGSAGFGLSLCLISGTETSGWDSRCSENLGSRSRGCDRECGTVIGSLEVLVLGVPLGGSLLVRTAKFLVKSALRMVFIHVSKLTSRVPASFIFFFSVATGPIPHLLG